MDNNICIPFFLTCLSLVSHSSPGHDFSAWLSGTSWWVQLCLCGAGAAGATPLPLLLPASSCQDCEFALAHSARSFFACTTCLWKHPVGTWISRFCQLWLVLCFPWARMTSDICSTHGRGKPHGLEGVQHVADTALSSGLGPAGARRALFQR